MKTGPQGQERPGPVTATLIANGLAKTAKAPGGLSRLQTFSSLQYRDFRLLWVSTLFASAGNWIQQVTLGWLMYEVTGSAFLVGALHGARALPFLVIGPIGGVLGDRMDRRKLLIGTQIFLGLLALGFALLVALDLLQVWHFFAFSLLSGTGWAINHPARQALAANTVPRHAVTNAIALVTLSFNVNRILGPAVGGLLIALAGASTNFFIQGGCYLVVALVVFPMRVAPRDLSAVRRVSTLSNFREGLRYVAKEPTTLSIILLALVPSIFMMPFLTGLMPVFAKDALGVGPDGLGLLLACFGAGGLLGPIFLASAGNPRRPGLLLLGAGLLSGLALVAFSQATALALALFLLALIGAGQMFFWASTSAVLQAITPDHLRSRVMSLYSVDHGLVPLGSLLAGALAAAYGSPLAILAGGCVGTVLILLSALRARALRSLA